MQTRCGLYKGESGEGDRCGEERTMAENNVENIIQVEVSLTNFSSYKKIVTLGLILSH